LAKSINFLPSKNGKKKKKNGSNANFLRIFTARSVITLRGVAAAESELNWGIAFLETCPLMRLINIQRNS